MNGNAAYQLRRAQLIEPQTASFADKKTNQSAATNNLSFVTSTTTKKEVPNTCTTEI
jgi:hypothetical protein